LFVKVLDENIHHHTSNYNRFHKQLNDLRQYTSAEGQRILHEEQMSIETRWHRINRLTTDKVTENSSLLGNKCIHF
jgi:flagellar biosynthesis chaperone FliJ